VYQERLAGVVIDEAHCVVQWGLTFREPFSQLGELRSLMKSDLNIMALTTTATKDLRYKVESLLGMVNPITIIRSPDKNNLRLSCIEMSNIGATLEMILKELHSKRTLTPRIIIFCKNTFDCAKLYTFFELNMGSDFTEPAESSHSIQESPL
jgi:superfamily II DNA helicase RecQ